MARLGDAGETTTPQTKSAMPQVTSPAALSMISLLIPEDFSIPPLVIRPHQSVLMTHNRYQLMISLLHQEEELLSEHN